MCSEWLHAFVSTWFLVCMLTRDIVALKNFHRKFWFVGISFLNLEINGEGTQKIAAVIKLKSFYHIMIKMKRFYKEHMIYVDKH